MQKQLGKLASLNCTRMEPYQQLIEGGLTTEEAVSASLMQDEASELEYRAGVVEMRDRLRASSHPGAEVAAASSPLPFLARCSLIQP